MLLECVGRSFLIFIVSTISHANTMSHKPHRRTVLCTSLYFFLYHVSSSFRLTAPVEPIKVAIRVLRQDRWGSIRASGCWHPWSTLPGHNLIL